MKGEIAMAAEDKAPAIDGDEAVLAAVAVAAPRREVRGLRAVGDRYSWLEDYLARLDDKRRAASATRGWSRHPASRTVTGGIEHVRLGDVFDARVSGRSPGVPRMDSGDRAWDAIKSTVVGLLLLSVVVAAIAGSEAAYFCTVLAAWAFFPLLVGVRRTLDAGCAFMLISIGVLVVVELAQNGPGSLMP